MYQATAAYDKAPGMPLGDPRCRTRKGFTRFLPVSSAVLLSTVLLPMLSSAQSAPTCPPISFPDTINLAKNPSFEFLGPKGSPTVYVSPSVNFPSAAADWFVHSSNPPQAPVTTEWVLPTTVPVGTGTEPTGPPEGQRRMLHVIAGGNEGGVYQMLSNPPDYAMFSIWVFVVKGQVVMEVNATNKGPAGWSEKHGEWEELRVCTDDIYKGSQTPEKTPVDRVFIYNEAPGGGEFYIDRVEVRRTLKPDHS